jgi:hypothetical protein
MLQLFAILMHAAPAPPVPPPPAESLAAATLLWADHPPTEATKHWAIESAVIEATTQALYRIGVQPSPRLSVTKAYLVAYERLKPLIARRVPANRRQLDMAVAACAMEGVARELLPAEIAEVRQSLSTTAGQKFWQAAGLSYWPLTGCYRSALNLTPLDTDYRAAGLRPPKPPKPPKPGTMIVS